MAVAIEIVRLGGASPERLVFSTTPIRIGRSPLNNVVLKNAWVSLHHGLIHFDDNSVSYSDLGSTNGSVLFEHGKEVPLPKMEAVQILAPGQESAELRLGVITLRIMREHTGRVAAPAAGAERNLETRLTVAAMPSYNDESPATAPPPRPVVATTPPPDPAPRMYSAGETRFISPEERRPPTPPPQRFDSAVPVAPMSPGESGTYRAGMTRMVPYEETAAAVDALKKAVAAKRAAGRSASDPLSRVWALHARSSEAAPALDDRARAFTETLAAITEAFARGLIELKDGLKEFGDGIGVRAVGGHTPLHRSQSAQELLSYLLEPGADTKARLEQLVDIFADLMIHEVALLNGVKTGLHKLVTDLDPDGAYRRTPEGSRRLGFMDRSLQRYAEYYKGVAEQAEAVVFGKEFARAYADALGDRHDDGEK